VDRLHLHVLAPSFIGEKSPAALFSDIGFVAGGKKRGFCHLR
jgi:hypothetical protein